MNDETALQNNEDSTTQLGALGLPETQMNFVLQELQKLVLQEPKVNQRTKKVSFGEKNSEALKQLVEPTQPDFVDQAR